MRGAIVAGQFYEKEFGKLDSQIKECFMSKRGPGETPGKRTNRVIKAVVSPHAGYQFSGPCAAWAYKEIGESQFAGVYRIIGTSHTDVQEPAITLETFSTPLGSVVVDRKLATTLLEKKAVIINDEAHAKEHSIEVQLPFLQFASKDHFNELKIVPIITGQSTDYKKLGLDIKEAIMESGRKTVIIASSDFTHYGRSYHYIPFSSDVPTKLYEMDEKAIEFIKNSDADGLMDYCGDTGATICGNTAIATMINAVKAKKAKLLQYYTSGDVLNDYKSAVGYASMVIE